MCGIAGFYSPAFSKSDLEKITRRLSHRGPDAGGYFFDADDIMTPGFIESRMLVMENNPELGYAGGLMETFPVKAKQRLAAASDPVNEILFFNPSFVTVPSNYIFKKDVLVKNNITFNKELSSTADRFFVLEVSKFAKGANTTDETGKLLYRITSQSMSNNVNPGLIIDNEKFYYQLKKKNLLPAEKLSRFKSIYFLSLAKGFYLVKYRMRVFKYLAMSFINHPLVFAENISKSILKIFFHKFSCKRNLNLFPIILIFYVI
jgi:hypothetical protein